MKQYKIKTGDDELDIYCDYIIINDDGHLELFIDTILEACFTEWDFFFRILPVEEEESVEEAIKRYYQGFSYLPPKAREESAIAKLVNALKELHDAVNAQ